MRDVPSSVGEGFTPSRDYPIRRKIRLPKILYRQGRVFFITIATHQRHPWFSLHPALAEQCVELLMSLAETRGAILYAWCAMPDHIHLLIGDDDVVDFIRLLKGRMTPLARRHDPGKRLWQRSFFDHALRQEESVYRIALYIWENPVRAGIVVEAHEYAWSGSSEWPDFRDWYNDRHNGRG